MTVLPFYMPGTIFQHDMHLSIYIIHKIICYYYYHNFTDVETEAQKEQIFCLWTYTYRAAEPGFEFTSLFTQPLSVTYLNNTKPWDWGTGP